MRISIVFKRARTVHSLFVAGLSIDGSFLIDVQRVIDDYAGRTVARLVIFGIAPQCRNDRYGTFDGFIKGTKMCKEVANKHCSPGQIAFFLGIFAQQPRISRLIER